MFFNPDIRTFRVPKLSFPLPSSGLKPGPMNSHKNWSYLAIVLHQACLRHYSIIVYPLLPQFSRSVVNQPEIHVSTFIISQGLLPWAHVCRPGINHPETYYQVRLDIIKASRLKEISEASPVLGISR